MCCNLKAQKEDTLSQPMYYDPVPYYTQYKGKSYIELSIEDRGYVILYLFFKQGKLDYFYIYRLKLFSYDGFKYAMSSEKFKNSVIKRKKILKPHYPKYMYKWYDIIYSFVYNNVVFEENKRAKIEEGAFVRYVIKINPKKK